MRIEQWSQYDFFPVSYFSDKRCRISVVCIPLYFFIQTVQIGISSLIFHFFLKRKNFTFNDFVD